MPPSSPRYEWQCITDQAAFAPRDGAGALVFKNRMWLLGGWNPQDKQHFPLICNSEVWSSADGRDWRLEVKQAPWEARHTAGYAVFNGRMWIVGGDMNQGHCQSDVWSSTDGVHWECQTRDVPWGPRALHCTVAFDGKLWVMGGQTLPNFAPSAECLYADVWSSEDGRAWRQVRDDCPWAPCGMVANSAVHRGRMWLIGGGTYSTPAHPERQYCNRVWASADGADWQCVAEASWPARQYHTAVVFDDRLWVLQGCRPVEGNMKDVWHSADGIEWAELPDTPWAPRHAASVYVFDEALWVVAGENMQADVWRLQVRDQPAV